VFTRCLHIIRLRHGERTENGPNLSIGIITSCYIIVGIVACENELLTNGIDAFLIRGDDCDDASMNAARVTTLPAMPDIARRAERFHDCEINQRRFSAALRRALRRALGDAYRNRSPVSAPGIK